MEISTDDSARETLDNITHERVSDLEEKIDNLEDEVDDKVDESDHRFAEVGHVHPEYVTEERVRELVRDIVATAEQMAEEVKEEVEEVREEATQDLEPPVDNIDVAEDLEQNAEPEYIRRRIHGRIRKVRNA